MSRTNQLDPHPDADSLNAFAEHLLPEQERQQILGHLATCSRCRQVMYLAQEAAVDIESPTPASLPLPRRAQQPRAWLANWRFAWVSAAACTAVLALSIAIYLRHAAPSQELAKALPQDNETISESPLPNQSLSKQTLPRQSSASATESRPRPLAAKPSGGIASLKTPAQPTVPPQPSALPMSSIPVESASASVPITPDARADAAPRPPLTEAVSGQATTSLNQVTNEVADQAAVQNRNVLAGVTQPARPQGVAGTASRTRAVAGSLRSGADSTVNHAQPSQTVSVAAAPIDLENGYLSSPTHADALSQADIVVAQNAMHAILPDGSVAVCTAAAQHHLLAIDAAGTLFLSNDLGKNWEPVVQQWTGLAIEVRVHLAPNNYAATASSFGRVAAGTAPGASPIPPALFEIVNDRALIWTSADGKTWKAK